MKINSHSLTEVGKVRKANEDAFGNGETINGHVFVVCDGMGGHVGGAMASQIAVKSILEFFSREAFDNIILAIDRAFQFANEQIFAFAQEDPSLQGMGTTAAVLIIHGNDCFIGHVGDSRIYLKTDGELHRLTKDHSYVQGLVDQGIISDEEAETHPKRNQILKALGHSLDVQGTVCQQALRVKAGDVFLLCSDGLNGMIRDEYIDRCIDPSDLVGSVNRLYQGAMDNRGADNITATLVAIEQSAHTGKSQFTSFSPRLSDATLTSFPKARDSQKKKAATRKKNALILASLVLVIGLGGTLYFTMFRGDETDQGDVQVEGASPIYKIELEKKTLAELQGLAEAKSKTAVDNGIELTTSDKKKVRLTVEDSTIISVELIEGVVVEETPPQGDNGGGKQPKPRPTPTPAATSIVVGGDKKIKDVMDRIKIEKKCDPVDENTLYSMNLNAIRASTKLTKDQKRNYETARIVPGGFVFSYKCVSVKKDPAPPKGVTKGTISVPVDTKIADLAKRIKVEKKCDPVDEDALFKLNLGAIKSNTKFSKEQKRNYETAKIVPKGFVFSYECK